MYCIVGWAYFCFGKMVRSLNAVEQHDLAVEQGGVAEVLPEQHAEPRERLHLLLVGSKEERLADQYPEEFFPFIALVQLEEEFLLAFLVDVVHAAAFKWLQFPDHAMEVERGQCFHGSAEEKAV